MTEETRDPYDDHEAENDALETMRKRGEWDYTYKTLRRNAAYEKGLEDAAAECDNIMKYELAVNKTAVGFDREQSYHASTAAKDCARAIRAMKDKT